MCNENKVKNISWKNDADALFWLFWAHTGQMDPQRHNNECYLICRHSHDVAHQHQKLSERRLNTGIVLLHDNIRSHMARLTQSILKILKFKVLMHPVYSPDLSLCDYEVFSSLKKFFEDNHFSIDKEVKKAVREWMLQTGAEFRRCVMYKLLERR